MDEIVSTFDPTDRAANDERLLDWFNDYYDTDFDTLDMDFLVNQICRVQMYNG